MKKQYDRILQKAEQRINRNFYTNSVRPVKHSEYTFNDSAKHLLKVVYVEYFPLSFWRLDGIYYKERYRFDKGFPHFHYLKGKLWNKNPGMNYGTTFPVGKKAPNMVDISNFHSDLSQFVKHNRDRREAYRNNTQKDRINYTIAYTNDKFIASAGQKEQSYMVTDTLYNDTMCYKLTYHGYAVSVYGEKERENFERKLNNDYSNYTPDEKEELKYYVENWGNASSKSICEYIINKKDCALLHVNYIRTVTNSIGESLIAERRTEYYEKGKDNKYYQTYYEKYMVNFVHGTIYPNDKNIVTCIIQTPIDKPYSLIEAKKFPGINNIGFCYEDFCEVVDSPDEEMLIEWTNLNIH